MTDTLACPNCTSTSLVFGACHSTGNIYFRPFNVPFLTFRTADIAIKAGMCRACGTVTLVGDLEKLRALQSSANEARPTGASSI
ncbi:MAG: hypothetical protein HZA51_01455 [Planctomycetes bacterium]|nr:hypothetical protein [Planctomycetota bacterium]